LKVFQKKPNLQGLKNLEGVSKERQTFKVSKTLKVFQRKSNLQGFKNLEGVSTEVKPSRSQKP